MIPSQSVCIRTLGCAENALDSGFYRRYFEENGWRIVEESAEADLILINSCGYKGAAVDESIRTIQEEARKKRADSLLVVCGCLPAINRSRLDLVFDGPTFTPATASLLDGIVDPAIPLSRIEPSNSIHGDGHEPRSRIAAAFTDWLKRVYSPRFQGYDSTLYYVRIATGCLGRCSYCAIRKARGRLHSKPPQDVLAEFERGLAAGHKSLVLCSGDVGAYGRDIGTDIVALLNELIRRDGDYGIILRNFEPMGLKHTFSRLVPILQSSRVISITVPFQSGSNRILRSMNRSYDIDELRSQILAMRRACPSMLILSHAMVGFPGETEQDFRQTADFLRAIPFDNVEVNVYENHPASDSYSMEPQIDPTVKQRRYRVLNRICTLNMLRAFAARRLSLAQ